ncbi:MAG: histidine kinase [Eubacterium sp.]|nr:histidine kinase [Eubacterium sp.]
MLSRIYRLTLSKEGQNNTLENEIEHVETYVSLQNMRFNDSVELIIDVPDDLLDYEIPKLTLQPIVENAILHGIMEKESREGCIVISAWQMPDHIVVLVSDDGIGMTQEQISNILLGQGESKTGFNIAVVNTHERIRLLYGARYGLSYSSTYGKGTEVEIHLPLAANLTHS